jgi:hypothetical protein
MVKALGKANPDTKDIRCLNLVSGKFTTDQVTEMS